MSESGSQNNNGDEGGEHPDEAAAAREQEASKKVINRSGAKLVVSGAESGTGKSTEPREIDLQPREVSRVEDESVDTEEPAEVVPEEVVRLESRYDPGKERIKVDKAKFEKLEPRPDGGEREEEKWGDHISIGWWVGIAGVCAVVLLVGGLVIKHSLDNAKTERREVKQVPKMILQDPFKGSPRKWFHENTVFVKQRAAELLDEYVRAPSDQERAKLVKDPEAFLEHVKNWPEQFRPRAKLDEFVRWEISDVGETSYMVLRGRSADFMPLRIYFVRVADDIRIDWHATVAWSEVPMQELKRQLQDQKDEIARRQLAYEKLVESAKLAEITYQKQLLEYRRQQIAIKEAREAALQKEYIVKQGDTLGAIAQKVGVTVDALIEMNDLKDTVIRIGQRLVIPRDESAAVPELVEPMPRPTPPPSWKAIEKPEMPEALYTEPIMMRCLLSRRDEFYAGPYNERDHSAFLIKSRDKSSYLWAYVKRGSDLDSQLRKVLDHGRFVVNLKKDYPVMIQVQRSESEALPVQVDLLGLVSKGWVKP